MCYRGLLCSCACVVVLYGDFPGLVVPVQLWGFPGSSKLESLLTCTNITPTGQGINDLGTHVIIIALLYRLGRNS